MNDEGRTLAAFARDALFDASEKRIASNRG
jgi:hypothetical protein